MPEKKHRIRFRNRGLPNSREFELARLFHLIDPRGRESEPDEHATTGDSADEAGESADKSETSDKGGKSTGETTTTGSTAGFQ